ncbi:hypothetical protein M885DRAFT_545066 [Pelagophyceae sp. CCMP2097]|nr:hypothetical protein M885DRAFT_545066 [Pelagophyceae sp. CCMP2097]
MRGARRGGQEGRFRPWRVGASVHLRRSMENPRQRESLRVRRPPPRDVSRGRGLVRRAARRLLRHSHRSTANRVAGHRGALARGRDGLWRTRACSGVVEGFVSRALRRKSLRPTVRRRLPLLPLPAAPRELRRRAVAGRPRRQRHGKMLGPAAAAFSRRVRGDALRRGLARWSGGSILRVKVCRCI